MKEQALQHQKSMGVIKPCIQCTKGAEFNILIGISPRSQANHVMIPGTQLIADIELASTVKIRSHGRIIRKTRALLIDSRAASNEEKINVYSLMKIGYEHVCSFPLHDKYTINNRMGASSLDDKFFEICYSLNPNLFDNIGMLLSLIIRFTFYVSDNITTTESKSNHDEIVSEIKSNDDEPAQQNESTEIVSEIKSNDDVNSHHDDDHYQQQEEQESVNDHLFINIYTICVQINI